MGLAVFGQPHSPFNAGEEIIASTTRVYAGAGTDRRNGDVWIGRERRPGRPRVILYETEQPCLDGKMRRIVTRSALPERAERGLNEFVSMFWVGLQSVGESCGEPVLPVIQLGECHQRIFATRGAATDEL